MDKELRKLIRKAERKYSQAKDVNATRKILRRLTNQWKIMIEESYVSLETAKLLKEAGFDVPCDWSYNEDGKLSVTHSTNSVLPKGCVTRPTLALAARWLREVKSIHIQIYCTSEPGWGYMADIIGDCYEPICEDSKFPTYERAMEVGLGEVLEWICRK